MLALAAAVLPSSAVRGAVASSSIVLSGPVVVTAHSSYSVTVVVPKDVTVAQNQVTISGGGGRWWGYLLHRNGDVAGHSMFDLRAGDCLRAGCAPAYRSAGAQCWCLTSAVASAEPIARGTYTLYVIADGPAVTIKIALPGAVDVRIAKGLPLPITWTAPRRALGSAGPSPTDDELYSAGALTGVGKQGGFVGLDLFRYQVVPELPQWMGVCESAVRPPTGANGADYQYPCNTAEAQGPSDVVPVLVGVNGTKQPGPVAVVSESMTSVYVGSAGTVGRVYLGGYLDTPQPAPAGGLNMLWFNYRPGTTKL